MYEKALEAILKIYSDKLKEYMTDEEYSKFNEEIIKEMVCGKECLDIMSNFKRFLEENKIEGSSYDS